MQNTSQNVVRIPRWINFYEDADCRFRGQCLRRASAIARRWLDDRMSLEEQKLQQWREVNEHAE